MNKLFAFALLLATMCFAISAQNCKHARILGATWGIKDVTDQIAHSYNLGVKDFSANEATFGTSFSSGTRILTAVYE